MRYSLCLLLLLAMVVGCGSREDDFVSVATGQDARDDIAREDRNGTIPASASDFYYWDEGFLSDHTTFWSFKCESMDDCKAAVAPPEDFRAWEQPRYDLVDWEQPTFDFILSGPAYFGDQHKTDKWDVRAITRGSFALYIHHGERVSELQYTAIDHDLLRVYRLRWFGDSLTTKLDEIGYKESKDSPTRRSRRVRPPAESPSP